MRDHVPKYLLVLPAVVVVLATPIWPLIRSLTLSICQGRLTRPGFPQGYIGVKNYYWGLFDNPAFWNSVVVTTVYTIVTLTLIVLIALGLALLVVPGGRLRT